MTGRIERTQDSFEPRINADDTDQKGDLASAFIRVHQRSSAAKTAFLFVPKCIRMHPHASGCIHKNELNDQSHRISGDSPRFPNIPHPQRMSRRTAIEKANPPSTT